jgi:hypothetical protein
VMMGRQYAEQAGERGRDDGKNKAIEQSESAIKTKNRRRAS